MLGCAPRESKPALLRTLTFLVIFFLEPPAAAAVSSVFFRRQRRKAAIAKMAKPATTPITIPATAPPDRPSLREMSTLSLLALPTTTVGVEVTVRVTISPETVVSIMLVTGVADAVVCGGLLVLVGVVLVDDVVGGGGGMLVSCSWVVGDGVGDATIIVDCI